MIYQYLLRASLLAQVGKESAYNAGNRRRRFDPWVGKMPWRGKWQPTPVFWPGKSHGQRSLAGYSPLAPKRVGHDWACTILPQAFIILDVSFCLLHCMYFAFVLSASVKKDMESLVYPQPGRQLIMHFKIVTNSGLVTRLPSFIWLYILLKAFVDWG